MCGLTEKSLETKPWDWVLSRSSEPCFWGIGPGVRGVLWPSLPLHKHRGMGSSNWNNRCPRGARWTLTGTPSPSDQTNPSQTGSPLQPEGHRTALSPCISYRWSLRNCLAVLWASGWRREQGQIQANNPFVWSCSVMPERQRPHTHRLANNHTQLINIKIKG